MTDRMLTPAERLRADFDHSFAVPARTLDEESEELLAVEVGGRAYALRLSQTSSLYPDRPVTPLPTSVGALRGLAGFAGVVVPVYDLATLLGHPIPDEPRWLVLAAGTPSLALALHRLDHHVRVPIADVVEGSGAASRSCLRGMVRLPDGDRPIVDVPATRALAHRMAGHEHPEVNP